MAQGHQAYLGGVPAGMGVNPQQAFLSRNVWLPIVVTFPSGQTKPV